MTVARPLPGLPAYGEPALSFPEPGAFREGFVVEFTLGAQDGWVGNFATAWDGWESSVHPELGARSVLVVAGGAGYLVDAEQRKLVRQVGSGIRHVWFQQELGGFVVSNGLWFDAFDAEHLLWRSRRVAWDEVRGIDRAGMLVTGEALGLDDRWYPFRLNLENGEVEGGSYDGPPD